MHLEKKNCLEENKKIFDQIKTNKNKIHDSDEDNNNPGLFNFDDDFNYDQFPIRNLNNCFSNNEELLWKDCDLISVGENINNNHRIGLGETNRLICLKNG